ncbi:hypothetical protein PNH50_06710 [Leisingera aquaemixtae]|jgi:hypothetical protein|uniref:CTP synthetase n=1 Tax=Leisingera aquaemixtae TaxID=1396826 RepID=A0A0P1HE01_9RHOB|nr:MULTISPECIES: hypothetical protein [Leisingera]EDZ47520.1 conserved hypothetical protein [Rhodobacterales bacterium Y4I]QDI76188.1 hypothetical protein R2C4_10650 [Leisingera aquaemixtae]UWQ26138.1 hypothetical protein K3553_06680 [Leisingera aquaemixtae]UWQ38659.1 hypothetical protein K3552_06540 [Leisingera aquaemixtae]UWQ42761.1 hypothetical protein K3718_06645 [Leisingera aquaemixtae]
MLRLASILYSLIGSSLAGAGVIAVLAAGLVTTQAILAAAAAGAVLGMPVAWLVARQLYARGA